MNDLERYYENVRREMLPKLREAHVTITCCPTGDQLDVKFCTELGASIMLGKPIVVVTPPGVVCPPGLRRVAHAVVKDETELAAALQRILNPGVERQ